MMKEKRKSALFLIYYITPVATPLPFVTNTQCRPMSCLNPIVFSLMETHFPITQHFLSFFLSPISAMGSFSATSLGLPESHMYTWNDGWGFSTAHPWLFFHPTCLDHLQSYHYQKSSVRASLEQESKLRLWWDNINKWSLDPFGLLHQVWLLLCTGYTISIHGCKEPNLYSTATESWWWFDLTIIQNFSLRSFLLSGWQRLCFIWETILNNLSACTGVSKCIEQQGHSLVMRQHDTASGKVPLVLKPWFSWHWQWSWQCWKQEGSYCQSCQSATPIQRPQALCWWWDCQPLHILVCFVLWQEPWFGLLHLPIWIHLPQRSTNLCHLAWHQSWESSSCAMAIDGSQNQWVVFTSLRSLRS